VAARALVTNDVPPYAIVGGNPAGIIRTRFDEKTIAALLDSAWWDLPKEEIAGLIPLLQRVPRNLERALTLVQGSRGIAETVMSSFVTVTFSYTDNESAEACIALVERLIAEVNSDVKVVYGKRSCLQGTLSAGLVM
jgi:hypothetical protein